MSFKRNSAHHSASVLLLVYVYSCQLLEKLAERVEPHRRCRWLFDLVIGEINKNSACAKQNGFCYFPFAEDKSSHIRNAHLHAAFLAYTVTNDLACTQLSKPRLDTVNDHCIFFLGLQRDEIYSHFFFLSLVTAEFILRAQQKNNTELSSKSNPLYFKTDD